MSSPLIYFVLPLLLACSPAVAECFSPSVGKSCNDLGYISRASELCKEHKLLIEIDELTANQKDFKSGRGTFDIAVMGLTEISKVCRIAQRLDGAVGLQILKVR